MARTSLYRLSRQTIRLSRSSTIRVFIPDMIHNLFIGVIRILRRVNGITAGHKATFMIRVYGMLIIFGVGKTDLMLQAPRCILSDMIVVISVAFEPQFAKGAFFPLVNRDRARAPWWAQASLAAEVCGMVIVINEVITGRTICRRTVAAALARSC